ncbi:MAG: hypothetical protein JNN15_08125 [Blastocatellia bacterium]|nr:hypothetical protein [Blastocatellia bacterium]
MPSQHLIVRKSNSAKRCDICHCSDLFDPDTGTCKRCVDLKPNIFLRESTPEITRRESSSIHAFIDRVPMWMGVSFLLMIGAVILFVLLLLIRSPFIFVPSVLIVLIGIFIITLITVYCCYWLVLSMMWITGTVFNKLSIIFAGLRVKEK